MIQLFPDKNDDENFVGMVERIINAGLNLNQPAEVFIVKVDHWFDFKWRQFSHKIFGALGIWRERLRVPPFIPDRIVEEAYFEKAENRYVRTDEYFVHIYQTSSDNAIRKIKRRSAIYVWFSGDTANNTQASLMIYAFKKDFQNSWYVSFIKKADWQVYKTDNISKAEVKAMCEHDYLALIR